jgi:hypothetical protein
MTRTQHPPQSTTEQADADADMERESGEHASRVALEVCSRLHAKSPTRTRRGSLQILKHCTTSRIGRESMSAYL